MFLKNSSLAVRLLALLAVAVRLTLDLVGLGRLDGLAGVLLGDLMFV